MALEKKNHILTMGAVLFNWKVLDWQNFYYKVADEAPVDEVYLGEVVCSKRTPFFEPVLDKVIERLERAGKKVHLSTLMLTMTEHETRYAKKQTNQERHLIEANDSTALALTAHRPHIVGPYVNVYNEDTLQVLEKNQAVRVCLPIEMDKKAIEILTQNAKAEIEIMVYGRLPLAISARCYHARLHGTGKNGCGFVCEQDYNGLVLKTLMNESFLAINGTQTMSHTYCNLVKEIPELQTMGVTAFRLSPQYIDMAEVAKIFKAVIEGSIDPQEAFTKLLPLRPDNEPYANGFYYGTEGRLMQKEQDIGALE